VTVFSGFSKLCYAGLTPKGDVVKEPQGVQKIPVKDIAVEEGSQEMANSPSMQPYMDYVEGVFAGRDPTLALEAVSKLPLKQRYIWRIASALKWAFCDFDNMSVEADRATLEEADLKKVLEMIQFRPIEFCLFLKAMIGENGMERVMQGAVNYAKQR
jgi:hypothetical protein